MPICFIDFLLQYFWSGKNYTNFLWQYRKLEDWASEYSCYLWSFDHKSSCTKLMSEAVHQLHHKHSYFVLSVPSIGRQFIHSLSFPCTFNTKFLIQTVIETNFWCFIIFKIVTCWWFRQAKKQLTSERCNMFYYRDKLKKPLIKTENNYITRQLKEPIIFPCFTISLWF